MSCSQIDCLTSSSTIALVYLVVSFYTIFVETRIHASAFTPRVRLSYWYQSLCYNRKFIPALGFAVIFKALYEFYHSGSYFFLAAAITYLLTPVVIAIFGKVPIINKRMTRIHQRYEPDENLTPNQVKTCDVFMKKWIFFHKIRCFLALGGYICILIAINQSSASGEIVQSL